MTKRKRFILYPILALLFTYVAWTKVSVFVADVKYHNSNHAPSMNGKNMEEFNGYFLYPDSVSKHVYYVSNEFIQRNCNCGICKEKESLLVKAGMAMNIIKEKKPDVEGKELITPNFGATVSQN